MDREHSSGSSMARPIPKTSIGDSRPTTIPRSTIFTKRQLPQARKTIFHRARGWNTIPAIMLPMSLTRMDIHSRSSARANERVAAAQGSSRSPLMKKGSMSLYSRIFTVGPLGAFPCAIETNAC